MILYHPRYCIISSNAIQDIAFTQSLLFLKRRLNFEIAILIKLKSKTPSDINNLFTLSNTVLNTIGLKPEYLRFGFQFFCLRRLRPVT